MSSEEKAGIFRIPVPLPSSPLKAVNAWLLRGKERSLLVDNGFNSPESERVLLEELRRLDVRRERLDFFITHLHSDHCGLTHRLLGRGSRIYCGRVDGERINAFIKDPSLWPQSLTRLREYAFPQEDLEKLVREHPGKVFASRDELAFTWVAEGDELEYGGYSLRVLDTPGHSPGHQVLYETREKFLISGDHILGNISPNIVVWEGMADSLGAYLESLKKISTLGARESFPGHRDVIQDTNARIAELLEHHAARLEEVMGILVEHPGASAWETASHMKWNMRGGWENFPLAQKCFAVGEAAAHLEHLRVLGKIPMKRTS